MTDSSEEDGRTLTPDLLPVGIRVSKFEAEPGFVSGEGQAGTRKNLLSLRSAIVEIEDRL
jgi:hypothetical protein